MADMRTATTLHILNRFPGQVPDRRALEARLVLMEAERVFKPKTEPAVSQMVPTVQHAVSNLGLDGPQEADWATFLLRTVQPQASEVSIRQAVIAKMFEEKIEAALRRPMWDRIQAYMRHVKETGETMEKAGPYVGPKGGKWADPKHTIPWKEKKPKKTPSVKLPDSVVSVLETDVHELAADPEGHGLEPDEVEAYQLLARAHDQKTNRLQMPSTKASAAKMAELITHLSNVADDRAEAGEEKALNRRVASALATLGSKVYKHSETLEKAVKVAKTCDATKALVIADDFEEDTARDASLQLNLELFAEPALVLEKAARGGKYIRRVPYTDAQGRKRYRYYYRESAVARGVTQVGEEIKLGERLAKVTNRYQGGALEIEIDGKRMRIGPDEWADKLANYYGETYTAAAEKRAKQTINAVLRHVPKAMLEDLKGTTDMERLAELKQRVPEVYKKLRTAFQRAGMTPYEAQRVLSRTLERRGWVPEARALAVGTVLKYRGTPITTLIDAAENLAGGAEVKPKHVVGAVELGVKGPEAPVSQIKQVAAKAERELAKLSHMLAQLQEGEGTAAELLAEAMASQAIQKLNLLSQAFPGLKDRAVEPSRQILNEVAAEAPQKPKREGAETVVYVAGEGGAPKAIKAKYRLVEADQVIASHDPETFGKRADYPEGVQERAYHRDKAEQAKVIRNAQRMDPRFVVNTNPDAVNGPPMVTKDGVVLGGNSRAMSMQRIYTQHPDKAEEMRQYLVDHAHEVGFKPGDIEAMKNPVLIREVEVEDTSQRNLQVLVRQMNESFTQGLDPRTMQVAMARRLSDETMKTLADTMKDDETLAAFFANKRSAPFVNALYKAGIIDDRNANQYMKKGTRTLNADGVQLVSRLLMGRTVPDADILSDTAPSLMNSIAKAVPALTQARTYGAGYDLSGDLAVAISAFNDLQAKVGQGVIRNLDPKMPARDFEQLFNHFQTLPGVAEPHPVLGNERATMLLEVLVRRRGPQQMAQFARDYVSRAAQNPEGQGSLLGPPKTPVEVLSEAVDEALGKKRSQAVGLFKALIMVPEGETIMQKHLVQVGDEVMELVKAEPRGGKYHRRVPRSGGKGYQYIYDEEKYATRADAHVDGKAALSSRMAKAVMGAVEAAGKSGCAIKSLSGLAAKHGKEGIADAVKACLKKGDLTYKGGKLYKMAYPAPMDQKPKAEKEKPRKNDEPEPEDEKTKKSAALVLGDAEEFAKAGGHKYIKRTGTPGNYQYVYAGDQAKTKAKLEEAQAKRKAKAKRAQPAKPGGPDLPKPGKTPEQWVKLPPGRTVAQHVKDASQFLRAHKAQLPTALKEIKELAGAGKVKGRTKTLQSALGKMVKKPKYTTADKLQDGTGLRVIHGSVAEVKDTVAKLKEKYKVLDEDNYIDTPQGDYRSHHLIIEGPGGLAMEVQVRTENQNKFADWCHDVYKPMSDAQSAAAEKPEVLEYSSQIADYFWALDSGKEPPPKPPCTKVISEAFGCL